MCCQQKSAKDILIPDVHAIASQCIDKVFGKPKLPVGATDHLTCTQLLHNVLTKFSEKPKLPVGATDPDVHAFCFDEVFRKLNLPVTVCNEKHTLTKKLKIA